MEKIAARNKNDAMTASVEAVARMFCTLDQARTSICDDDAEAYASHLNNGDAEMVITALVRRADTGEFNLETVLDARRAAAWREIADRHDALETTSMEAMAARMRQSAAARPTKNIAMMDIENEGYENAVASLTGEDAQRLLPGITLKTEDRLLSYGLNITVSGKPTAEGLAYIKRLFTDLPHARCLILALLPEPWSNNPTPSYEVLEK